jgi:hypothetical protein
LGEHRQSLPICITRFGIGVHHLPFS